MKQKISKSETKKNIEEFFKEIQNKTPKEIKKVKKDSMNKNIPLKGLRKKFCKKCFNPYKNPEIRIKNKMKRIICENCGFLSRYKF